MRPRDTMQQPNDALYERHPLDTYLSSASLERPTGVHSVLNEFMRGITGTVALGTDIESSLYGQRTAGNQKWHDALNSMDLEIANEQGVTQKSLGWIANMAGQTLSLAPLAGEAVGGAIAEKVGLLGGRLAAKAAPGLVEKTIPKMTFQGISNQTVGQYAKKTLRYGFGFAGFTAPEAFEEAYDEKTNAFNYRSAALQIGANGLLGAAIPSAQFLMGLLGKKLGFSLAKTISKVKETDLGILTPEEQQWVRDYKENPEDPKVHAKASELVQREGFQVGSHDHKVNLKLLTDNDGANLEKVTTDPLFADIPQDQKTAIKDFILHGRLDELRGNKSIADGLFGWLDHIEEHLKGKEGRLAEAEKGMLTGIKEHMQFSQKGIYRQLKKAQFEESHLAHVPYTVPENVLSHIRTEQQIRKLETKMKKTGENKQTRRRIDELASKQAKLATPKEELVAIHAKLSDKDFIHSKEYHRLTELAHYWPQARKLLDRFHLEEAHNAQEAYRQVLDAFAKIIKGNLSPLANPSRVSDYLKARLEQSVGKIVPEEVKPKVEVKKEGGEPVDAEKVAAEGEAIIERSESDALKEEYANVKRKTEQFLKNPKILKNLITCVLGTRNGQV